MERAAPQHHSSASLEAVPSNPLQGQFAELQRAQEHSHDLLSQVESKLLVSENVAGSQPKAEGTLPGYSTELRNHIQRRYEAAEALNQRLQDLLDRVG